MTTSNFNQHFPGYEILGELGRSNARVLKARNQVNGELVAIKHFSFNTDATTLRRFQQESEIMTTIKHPNIVKIKEVSLDTDMPYVVMELIEGGDLRSLLNETGPLDVPTTIRLGLQMAEAFKVIHQQGVIHRDIKPENIMYRPLPSGELHFLLTDFGIAKIREQSVTVTGQSLMTYEYASPEQFENPKGVAAATDYYSLGVVLYECLSGRVPFILEEGRVRSFINQVMDAPPPALSLPSKNLLPESLRSLINGLLAKRADERIKDDLTLKRKLKRAEMEEAEGQWGETPVTTEPGKKAIPPPKPKSNVLGTIIVILIAIGLIYPLVKRLGKDKDTQPGYSGDTAITFVSDTNPPASTKENSITYITRQFKNNEKYEGGWINGHAEGQGKYYDANGIMTYSGEYKNGKRDGYGTSYYNGDTLYSGDWKNDVQEGRGTIYYNNGEKYVGTWSNNMRSGEGNYYDKDGNRYEGEWVNDLREGKGSFYWKNSGRYDGAWKNGTMEGFGRYYDSNGKLMYEGEWKDGKSVETFPNRY